MKSVQVVIREHTPISQFEYCDIIGEDVSWRVCAVLCKKKLKCAMKWKGKSNV